MEDFAQFMLNERSISFTETILPKIKLVIKDTLEALCTKIQASRDSESAPLNLSSDDLKKQRCQNTNQFELFGYDFMIANDLKLYLIEVNTNPCLDTSPCALLQKLIPNILDQTFKVCIDPFLQSADYKKQEQNYGSSAQEMTTSEFQFEMLYSNADQIKTKYNCKNNDL